MKRTLIPIIILLLPALAVTTVRSRADTATFQQQLKQAGVHAIMRHAIAPGTGDPAEFAIGDCATRRIFDERGRRQARQIGEELRKAGVEFDRILTSQWCRCQETAQSLQMGDVEAFAPLNSFFRDRSTADEQSRAVREFLASLPDDERVMLVTHQVNITALTGMTPSSGEVFLIRVADDGQVEVVNEFLLRP